MEKPGQTVPDKIAQYYEHHPEEADKIGTEILAEDRQDRQEMAELDGLASSGGNDPYSNQFRMSFLGDIGMSWWKWQILLLGLEGVTWALRLPGFVHLILYIFIVTIFVKNMA